MPLDYRRFNGPEDSVSYKVYTKDYVKTYEDLYQNLFKENGMRKDGRALEEARGMCMFFVKTDVVPQAKGSAYVELQETKVVCSVFDPREIPHQNEFSQLGQIFCDVKYAPFSCSLKRRPHVPDAEEKALSAALKKALEPTVCRHLFPNFQIDVFVYILENDGSCLAAAINAAGMALANAAVPMYDIITACSAAIIGDKIFIDPTAEEEYVTQMIQETDGTNHGIVTMSTLKELRQICDLSQTGSLDIDCVTNLVDILENECEKIVTIMRQLLVVDVIQSFQRHKQLEEEEKKREAFLVSKIDEWKALLVNGG